MHILLLNAFWTNVETKPCVDHIDNHKSNNNISNLRWATHTENGRNQTKSEANKSGVREVLSDENRNEWKSSITIDYIVIYLGEFDNLEDAKPARIKRSNEAYAIYTMLVNRLIILLHSLHEPINSIVKCIFYY